MILLMILLIILKVYYFTHLSLPPEVFDSPFCNTCFNVIERVKFASPLA